MCKLIIVPDKIRCIYVCMDCWVFMLLLGETKENNCFLGIYHLPFIYWSVNSYFSWGDVKEIIFSSKGIARSCRLLVVCFLMPTLLCFSDCMGWGGFMVFSVWKAMRNTHLAWDFREANKWKKAKYRGNQCVGASYICSRLAALAEMIPRFLFDVF